MAMINLTEYKIWTAATVSTVVSFFTGALVMYLILLAV